MADNILHGLVFISSSDKPVPGMNRSILAAEAPLRDQNIELHYLFTQTYWRFFCSLLRLIFKEKRLRYDFLLINSAAALINGFPLGLWLARLMQIRRRPNSIYWHETEWAFSIIHEKWPTRLSWIDAFAKRASTKHLTASSDGARAISGRYPQAKPTPIFECVTAPPSSQPQAASQEPPCVVNIASIQERKGVELFVETAIKTCRQHDTVEFHWLGVGKHYGSYLQDIDAAGLSERIRFPGYRDDAWAKLQQANLLFLSSRDDPFPLAVLEAMALGCTVMVFNVGGAPEALNGHGIVIESFDTAAAAAAILKQLSRSPEESINLPLQKEYEAKYTPEKFAERFNRTIREALE